VLRARKSRPGGPERLFRAPADFSLPECRPISGNFEELFSCLRIKPPYNISGE
jgi:hypothetical protein